MRVDLDRLLWRTRGREWDYSFVLRPAHHHIENWYDFHVDVFSGTTPLSVPKNSGGVLIADGKEMRFIATTFQDPHAKDSAGRPVVHYLVWFPVLSSNETKLEVRADWGLDVVRSCGDAWTKAFSGAGESEEDILSEARSRLKSVEATTGSSEVVQFRQRVVEKKKPKLPRQTRSPRLALLAVAGILVILLLVWFVSQ